MASSVDEDDREPAMESGEADEEIVVREVCANGISIKTTEVEAKLDEGNIQEAESSLREGLSLNFEVCLFTRHYFEMNLDSFLTLQDVINIL